MSTAPAAVPTVLDRTSTTGTALALGGPPLLAVDDPLDALLPWGGLRRGEAVVVTGSTALALALVARATREGAWGAVVGAPDLGLAAAREHGVDLARLVLVPHPSGRWPEVVTTLVDALDVLVLRLPTDVPRPVARQLQARIRARGLALVVLADGRRAPTLERAPLRLTVEDQGWEGIGAGHGYLRRRWVEVRTEGSGAAARPWSCRLHLPTAGPGSER